MPRLPRIPILTQNAVSIIILENICFFYDTKANKAITFVRLTVRIRSLGKVFGEEGELLSTAQAASLRSLKATLIWLRNPPPELNDEDLPRYRKQKPQPRKISDDVS
jgi:hypothetical protein